MHLGFLGFVNPFTGSTFVGGEINNNNNNNNNKKKCVDYIYY